MNWNKCDKSNATLTGVNLSGAHLGWTNFEHSNLNTANLSNIKLDPPRVGGKGGSGDGEHVGTNFQFAILTGTRVDGADLHRAHFHGVVSGGLSGTPLSLPANWRIVNGFLIGPGAYLGYANLKHAVLDGANLQGANLKFAELAHASLTGVISGGITTTPLSLPADWRIANGFLVGPGSNLTGANLTGADLAGAHLAGAQLMNANLTGANLAGAQLGGAKNWLHATRTGATFSAATTCPNNLK